jgi:hypothetical protein
MGPLENFFPPPMFSQRLFAKKMVLYEQPANGFSPKNPGKKSFHE